MHEGIHITLKGEHLFNLWGLSVTNTLLMSWIAILVLVAVAAFVGPKLKRIPGRTQVLFETIFGFLLSYMEETLENKTLARRLLPLIATLFLFILVGNWLGLIPGIGSIGLVSHHGAEEHFVSLFHPMSTDLNVTLALALIAFFSIEVLGVLSVGLLKYGGKFVNFKSFLGFFLGIIELFSELARLVSFSFRLFGNMFAGKTLILVVMFFVPLIVPVPLMLYEVLVGFIQAAIFAMLTLFFVKVAIAEPH